MATEVVACCPKVDLSTVPQSVITYPANSYCSQANSLRQYTLTTWHFCKQNLALTSPTSGDRSLGKVRSSTPGTEFFLIWKCIELAAVCSNTCLKLVQNYEVEVTLWLTVSQSVSMSWYRAPLWDLRPDITSCRDVAVWNLRSCICWAPSQTRGRFFNLHLNLLHIYIYIYIYVCVCVCVCMYVCMYVCMCSFFFFFFYR
jgi:hypothetical protein